MLTVTVTWPLFSRTEVSLAGSTILRVAEGTKTLSAVSPFSSTIQGVRLLALSVVGPPRVGFFQDYRVSWFAVFCWWNISENDVPVRIRSLVDPGFSRSPAG